MFVKRKQLKMHVLAHKILRLDNKRTNLKTPTVKYSNRREMLD